MPAEPMAGNAPGPFQFRCRQFPRPEYRDLQLLRKRVLGGVTQRDALRVCLRVVKLALSKPGGLAVVQAASESLEVRGEGQWEPLDAINMSPPRHLPDPRVQRLYAILGEVLDRGVSINLNQEIRELLGR